MIARVTVGIGVVLGLALPMEAAAQEAPPIEVGGLLRGGARVHADSALGGEGFQLFESRVGLRGTFGLLFDYRFVARYDAARAAFRLHDAAVTLPLAPEARIKFGMFKPNFSLEAVTSVSDITFVKRAQAVDAIKPGRQIGVEAGGAAFEGRLSYGAGLYNGNGQRATNDGDNYMYVGRVQFNSVGTVAFWDEFTAQLGASLAYSSDTSAPLGTGIVTGDPAAVPAITSAFAGDRVLWSADLKLSYAGWGLTAEYLRADFDLDADLAEGGPSETEAYGGYAQLAYRAWGFVEGVVRYDGFQPALGADREFMVFGVNVYPDDYARFGVQYSHALDDSPHAATLFGGQFMVLAQLAF